MPPASHNPDLAARLIAICNDMTTTHAAVATLVAELLDGEPVPHQPPLQHGVKHPLKALPASADILAAHLRAHRPGRPSKIKSDPDLEAFILARIDRLTVAQIVSEVRAAFPPPAIAAIPALAVGGRNGRPERVTTPQPDASNTDGLQSQVTG